MVVVAASDISDRPALVLVEAKGHVAELSDAGKRLTKRHTPEEQRRTNDNHERIGTAIAEAAIALQRTVPGISISRDKNYQFANRIAFAWKLASLGIPVAMIYLGFIGDNAISRPGEFFHSSDHWQDAFRRHTAEHFPAAMQGRRIDCGAASFWLLVRELQVLRQSPPLEQRRFLI